MPDADPVSGLNETGVLVMGSGAKRTDSGFVGPTSKLNQDENRAVQLAKKYAMEQSIKMVRSVMKCTFFLRGPWPSNTKKLYLELGISYPIMGVLVNDLRRQKVLSLVLLEAWHLLRWVYKLAFKGW